MGEIFTISMIYENFNSSRRDDVGVAAYASREGPRPPGSSVYELFGGAMVKRYATGSGTRLTGSSIFEFGGDCGRTGSGPLLVRRVEAPLELGIDLILVHDVGVVVGVEE